MLLPFVTRKKFLDTCEGFRKEILEREKTIQAVVSINNSMKQSLSKADKYDKSIPVAGFDNTDAEPTDQVSRQEYIKDVEYFYDNVLEPKLKTSIADIRQMLSNIHVADGFPQNMQREQYDWLLRGMEIFAWKIEEWATTLKAERRASLQDKENQDV